MVHGRYAIESLEARVLLSNNWAGFAGWTGGDDHDIKRNRDLRNIRQPAFRSFSSER